ncbi:MAG: SLC13 family permease [Candidatus Hodarchaeales archaeon]|jgi:Na+/H+ antiporter NhaD/arsenite permease-like protein
MTILQPVQLLGLAIFVITYIIISTEKLHRPISALLGAAIISILLIVTEWNYEGHLTDFHTIISRVEWNTLIFITAMMIITLISSYSGLFQYVSIYIVRLTKGNSVTLLFSLSLLTFIISFIFDVITTMLILAPLTVEIYKILDLDFRPILIIEAITANFASISSLVGSIPNIVIADKSGTSFTAFILVMGPLSLILLLVAIPIYYFFARSTFKEPSEKLVKEIFLLDPKVLIEDRRTFYAVIVGLIVLVSGFIFGDTINLEAAEIALFVAAGLLLLSGKHPKDIFRQVEWISIYFIMGLFILVGSIEILGLLDILGEILTPILKLDLILSLPLISFSIGVFSAVVDNIPISAALAPVFADLEATGVVTPIFWWALVIAVNLGGYILPIGSPANIVAINFSNQEGSPITFKEFVKIGAILGFLHLLIGTIYLIILSSIL